MDNRTIHPISLNRPEGFLNKKSNEDQPAASFEKVLGEALGGVNRLQQQATTLNTKLASGQLEYIHQATAMAEKASLALELTLQIRNKALEAYQEIMRIQI